MTSTAAKPASAAEEVLHTADGPIATITLMRRRA